MFSLAQVKTIKIYLLMVISMSYKIEEQHHTPTRDQDNFR